MNSISLITSRCHYLFNELTSNKNCLAVKITSVATGVFSFYVLQFGHSLTFGCGMALIASTLTLFSEKVIRPLNPEFASSNWINTEIDTIGLKKYVSHVAFYGPLSVAIIYGCIVSPMQAMQSEIVRAVLTSPLILTFLITIIAPLSEEILFRGFLQEIIEDSLILTNLFIIEIKTEKIKQIASYASSLLFGALHTNQVAASFKKILIFITAAAMGKFLSDVKNDNTQSLLPCISIHMTHNTAHLCGRILANYLRNGLLILRS